MKFILLIAALLIFSMASSKVIEVKKSISRSIGDEDVALELKFFGTCEEFKARVLSTVWISKGQSCLPIQVNVTQNPDVDDLNAHFFCTHVDNGRSIIHFVEIFETSDATGYPDFVLSLIPSNPFRVLTPKTSLARRPNCHVTHDFCNETNAIVDSCSTNKVRTKERKNKSQYVVSQDRIYITANQQVSSDCKANGNCCAYVAPQEYGGICDHTGSKDLLSFPKKHDDHKEGKKKEGKKEGKKGGNRGGKKVAVNTEEEKKDDNEEQKREDDKVEVQVQKKRPGQGRKGKRPPTNRKGKNRPNSPAIRPPNHRNDRPASHRTSSHRTGSNRPPTRKSRPANNKPVNKKPTQPKEEDDDEEEEDEDKK